MAVDIIARGLGAGAAASAAEANRRLDNIGSGIAYKGAVDYYGDLPESPATGDAYTVKYRGSSGVEPDGTEYVWGDDGGTLTWIALGPDLNRYQEALTAGNGIEIGADNVIAATHDIFNVTLGTTAKAEILDAITAGRLPVIKYNDKVYIVIRYSSSAVTFVDAGTGNGYIVSGTNTYLPFSGVTFVNKDQGDANEGKTLRVDSEGKLNLADWPASETIYSTTYADLVAAQSEGTLVAGAFYRITDYVTKINGTYDITAMAGQAAYIHYAKSAEHPFDIIVQALDENTLSENASAIQHSGDTYFANSDLSSWQLKYTIENDPTKHAWADATNGKGVIYYMKDEFGNECHYDFKNVQYLAYAITYTDSQYADSLCYDASNQPKRYGSVYYVFMALQDYMQSGSYGTPFPPTWHKDFSVGANILGTIQFPTVDATYLQTFNADWYYSFDEYDKSTGTHIDKTLNSSGLVVTYSNVIGRAPDSLSTELSLQNIPEGLSANIFEYLSGESEWCWGNVLGDNSFLNVFGFAVTTHTLTQFSFNVLGNSCVGNSFGNDCSHNSFGNDCANNSFGNYCYGNSFGNDCDGNSFGNYCYSNSFGNDCDLNFFGNDCTDNSFGNDCDQNSFGNGCTNNSFGGSCNYNSFGNNCTANSFGIDCNQNSFGNGCTNNSFGFECTENSFGNTCNNCTFGYRCSRNSFGNMCNFITFGDRCRINSFGNWCSTNTFGNGCCSNSFGNGCDNNSFGNNCSSNMVCDGVDYIEIVNGTSNDAEIGRYTILSGKYVISSSDKYQITISTPLSNQNYAMYVGRDASGSVRIWNPAEVDMGVPYITTAPTADNTSGKLIFVVLASEPQTRYAGYYYIILGA